MIGVFGGTFDPIHFGHLRPALDVMLALGLDEVRFIPLHRAVHRDQPGTSAELRLQMVRAAIEGQAGFVADERELRRQGGSYTVDTLTSLGGVPRPVPLSADGYGRLQRLCRLASPRGYPEAGTPDRHASAGTGGAG